MHQAFFHFGCLVHVLDASRAGIHLGRLPQHVQQVALALSIAAGQASPQFHVAFDPSFQTMQKTFGNKSPPSCWQNKCGSIL
jgi:hypothetical protein